MNRKNRSYDLGGYSKNGFNNFFSSQIYEALFYSPNKKLIRLHCITNSNLSQILALLSGGAYE